PGNCLRLGRGRSNVAVEHRYPGGLEQVAGLVLVKIHAHLVIVSRFTSRRCRRGQSDRPELEITLENSGFAGRWLLRNRIEQEPAERLPRAAECGQVTAAERRIALQHPGAGLAQPAPPVKSRLASPG